ncbi:MAG TPA: BTAD domain-containing putative transcriptional regulator, partial [Chloroflexota bacterium]|nr:BTAD domain-containing putative transcriptional regulator [Chloroflexota bacterium]
MDGSQRGLRLEIRLLGDLQVLRGGHPQPLPASKKTRALLGYLVATGQAHLRERLCDLFWDGPNDPRAALRWSLTKIRPLLNDPAATRLIADRERVACVPGDAEVDAVQVRDLLRGGVAVASVPTLKTVIRLFRGEFLDGLQLPACYRYYEWCMAEREALSALRLAALSALVERLDDSPDEALLYARAWAAADPLSEAGHAAVVQALGQLRRNHEALQHYEYGRRLLESELAAPLSGELERAWQALRTAGSASSADSRSHAAEPLPVESHSGVSASLMGAHVGTEAVGDAGARRDALSSSIPLIGRIKELNQLARLAAAASSGESSQFVL